MFSWTFGYKDVFLVPTYLSLTVRNSRFQAYLPSLETAKTCIRHYIIKLWCLPWSMYMKKINSSKRKELSHDRYCKFRYINIKISRNENSMQFLTSDWSEKILGSYSEALDLFLLFLKIHRWLCDKFLIEVQLCSILHAKYRTFILLWFE